MAGVELKVPITLHDLRMSFLELEQFMQNPATLMKAIAVDLMKEVDRNFRDEGRPKWKAMAASTRYAKRSGSGKLLSGLRASFDVKVEQRKVTLFSTSSVAVFHEYGTKGPYEIRSKTPGKPLALPFFPGRDRGKGSSGTGKAGRHSLAGAGRAHVTNTGGLLIGGRTVRPNTNLAFYMSVMHPGLPARPMLPTVERGGEIARNVAVALLNRQIGRLLRKGR